MCCGDEVDLSKIKEIQDPTVIKARSTLLNTALANLGKNATPMPKNTPIAAGTNALRRNSSNLLNAMMTGKPYSSASPGLYGNLIDPSAVGKYAVGSASGKAGTEPDEDAAICRICSPPRIFPNQKAYQRHMDTVHGGNSGTNTGSPSGASQYFDPYSSDSWME